MAKHLLKKKRVGMKYFFAIVLIIVLAVVFSNFIDFRIITASQYSYYKDLENKTGEIYLLMNTIHKNYYKDIEYSALIESSKNGIIESLDDGYSQFGKIDTGKYVGIGVSTELNNNEQMVISYVKPGSSASEAGIQQGDILEKVNNNDVSYYIKNKKQIELGKPGDYVKLLINRKGVEKEFKVKVQEIKSDDIKTSVFDDKGYIALDSFQKGTSVKFKSAIEEFKSRGVKSIVIDLRNNKGGYVEEGLKILGMLEGEKIALYEVKKDQETAVKTIGTKIDNLPKLTFLVNDGTASTSEIVISNVEYYHLGTVIGEKTFGKDVEESMFNIGKQTLLLVTYKWLTPDKKDVRGGIEPDVEIKQGTYNNYKFTWDIDNDLQLQKALQ